MGDAALIDWQGVVRARGGGFRLEVPELTIRPGDQLALVGPSGSGKSTCLDMLALSLAPDQQQRMMMNGATDLGALWQGGRSRALAALRARHLGYVLQTGGLAPFLSLYENAMLSRRLLGMKGPGPVRELAGRLGIADLMQRKPRAVSIGERQRAAVLRALAHGPDLLLADEPTASLDQSNAEAVVDLMSEMARESGTALVLVTHDPSLGVRIGAEQITCRHDPATRTSTIVRQAV